MHTTCPPRRSFVASDALRRGQVCTEPFTQNSGYIHGDKVPYFTGPLASLGFSDSALYSNMNHSTLLQFADLILGATREFVECAMGKKASGFGVDIVRSIRYRFRGAPEHIYGRGLSVSSGNVSLRKAVKDLVAKELTGGPTLALRR